MRGQPPAARAPPSALTLPGSAPGFKAALFDVRRKYPWAIVVSTTVAALVPALVLKQASRVEKVRIMARNAFIGAGATTVLLYPEFVQQAAKTIEPKVPKWW